MSDDLIERLRAGADFYDREGDIGMPMLLREAASRIEALQQRIDETAARWAKWLDEQEALVEAREKELREVLKPFADSVDDGPDGWEINTAGPTEDDWLRARAVVKGQP